MEGRIPADTRRDCKNQLGMYYSGRHLGEPLSFFGHVQVQALNQTVYIRPFTTWAACFFV